MMYFVSVEEMKDILRYMFNMNIATSKISMHYAGNSWGMMYTGKELTVRHIYNSAINNGVAVQIKPTKVINSIEDYDNIEGILSSSELTPELRELDNFICNIVERRRYEEKRKRDEEMLEEENKQKVKQKVKRNDRWVCVSLLLFFLSVPLFSYLASI